MALKYHYILRQMGLRTNSLVGAQASSLEVTAAKTTLTSVDFKSGTFPFTAHLDALRLAEEMMCEVIAEVKEQPLRKNIAGVTAALSHLDAMPAVDSNNKKIIGSWGAVRDNVDHKICREKSFSKIQRVVTNTGTWVKVRPYFFSIDGGYISHTRTSVVVECCIFDAAARAAAIAANDDLLLPDVNEYAYLSAGLMFMVRDGVAVVQSETYATYFTAWMTAIRQGLLAPPMPSTASSRGG